MIIYAIIGFVSIFALAKILEVGALFVARIIWTLIECITKRID